MPTTPPPPPPPHEEWPGASCAAPCLRTPPPLQCGVGVGPAFGRGKIGILTLSGRHLLRPQLRLFEFWLCSPPFLQIPFPKIGWFSCHAEPTRESEDWMQSFFFTRKMAVYFVRISPKHLILLSHTHTQTPFYDHLGGYLRTVGILLCFYYAVNTGNNGPELSATPLQISVFFYTYFKHFWYRHLDLNIPNRRPLQTRRRANPLVPLRPSIPFHHLARRPRMPTAICWACCGTPRGPVSRLSTVTRCAPRESRLHFSVSTGDRCLPNGLLLV